MALQNGWSTRRSWNWGYVCLFVVKGIKRTWFWVLASTSPAGTVLAPSMAACPAPERWPDSLSRDIGFARFPGRV